ncbi:YkvA family protein [Anaerococcus sp. ENR1011]|uniref:YkvA family protein n=1 Tax=Anaerococcus groningensis TaxID=3115616 RepID=A0ABW9MZR7_9FIRM
MNKFNRLRTSIPAFFKALKNKNTPIPAKIAVAVAIAYAVLPADVVVDAIPFLGWFDDALVMTVLFAIANKMIPDYVMEKEKNEVIDDINYEVMD